MTKAINKEGQGPLTIHAPIVTIDGYGFSLEDNVWTLSREVRINWISIFPICDELIIHSLRLVLSKMATTHSAKHIHSQFNQIRNFFKWHYNHVGCVREIEPVSLANYRAALTHRNKWYVGVISGTIKRWSAYGYPGLGDGLIALISNWSTPGNIKGEAVQLQSVTDGAFTEFEFEALHSGICKSFEEGKVALEDFVIFLLFAFTGRRPIQLSNMKACDFVRVEGQDGLFQAVLKIPRAKQRGAGFRSDFTPFALSRDNALAISALINENQRKLEDISHSASLRIPEGELPLFPDWNVVRATISGLVREEDTVPVDVLHRKPASFGDALTKVAGKLKIISERTGTFIKIYPTRFRRTIGTRAAREGLSELVIARLLDHSDVQNVRVYTENVPEHVDPINKAVASEMALISQAFSGRLVDGERDARRGNDLSSRVRTHSGKATGTCGLHGFCGALAPIACYTCRSFQPWLDGPHQEVLDFLMAENERVRRETGDPQIASICNRTILAVSRVIQLCAERKAQLGGCDG